MFRIVLLSLFLFSSLAHATIYLDANGDDKRYTMTSSAFPWSAIGRISFTSGNMLDLCTGALVGKRLLLTAAHCVLTNNGTATAQITFQANYVNGNAAVTTTSQEIFVGTSQTQQDWKDDWAVVVLADPIGIDQGYFDLRLLGKNELPFSTMFAGYSGDYQNGQSASIDNCSIMEILPTHTFGHDCSTTSGASGGPIFYHDRNANREYIVGIHTRGFDGSEQQYTSANANIAVMNASVIAKVMALRQQYDQ